MKRLRRHSRQLRTTFAYLLLVAVLAGCHSEAPLVTKPSPPEAVVWIRGGDVLDLEAGTILRKHDVVLRDGLIETIAPAQGLTAPEAAREIDAEGATVMPGLIDSHGHVDSSPSPSWEFSLPDPARNLQAFLYSGVTTTLDPASSMSGAFDLREDVARGRLLGPRIFTAGPMVTALGGHPAAAIEAVAPWWIRWYIRGDRTIELDSPDAARKAVTTLRLAGSDVIKVAVDAIPDTAPIIRKEILAALIDEAHRSDLRVVAHVGSYADAIAAAEAGVDAWMHMPYKDVIDAERAKTLAGFGLPMVVTTTVFRSYANLGNHREPTTLERQTVAAETLQAFNSPPEDAVSEIFVSYFANLRQVADQWDESIINLHNAGVQLLAGSDVQAGVFPGPALHREIQTLAEAGIPNLEVLRGATLYGARLLSGLEDPAFGSLRAGKQADLIVVEGDPLADISNLEKIRWVVQQGVVIQRHPVVVSD